MPSAARKPCQSIDIPKIIFKTVTSSNGTKRYVSSSLSQGAKSNSFSFCIVRLQREPLAQNSVSPAPFQLAPSWTVQTTAAPKLFTSLNPFVLAPIWTDCLLLVLVKWLSHQWRKESLSWGRKVSDVDQDSGLRSSDLDTTCINWDADYVYSHACRCFTPAEILASEGGY